MSERLPDRDGEHLLEELLDPSSAAAGEARPCSGRDATRRAELDAFLQRSRAELPLPGTEWSSAREGALVERVLAETTREDLTWRGELALLAGFVRERWSASKVLRLVAASLVLHLAALPALAWYLQHEAEERPTFFTGIEEPGTLPPAELDEEETEAVAGAPEESEVTGRGPYAADAIENALRRARFVLGTRRGPVLAESDTVSEEAADSLERVWLIRRTRFLASRSWNSAWDDVDAPSAGPLREGRLAEILRAELLLDRYVLLAQSHPHLDALLELLSDLALSDIEGTQHEDLRAQRALAVAVLDRARAYGLWRWSAGFDPLGVDVPLRREWFEALSEAAHGTRLEGLLDPAAFGAWIAP